MKEELHNHTHEHEEELDSKYNQMFQQYDIHLHDEIVQETVKTLLDKKKKDNKTNEVLKFIFSTIELTSLRVTDNEDSILKLTEKINKFSNEHPDFPHVAAICVYPRFAAIVSNSLEADGVEITCVCGGFPSSQTFPEIKTVETALAMKDGATEIDTVLPVGFFLAEDYDQVSDELNEIKEACGEETIMKVILETGALQTAVNIKKAALIAMYSGADFIKTSTGKIEPGASPAAVYTMCKAIKEYHDKTGKKIGIKIAGGVRTTDDAIGYYTIVKEILGDGWINPNFFRIGASSLANNILSGIEGGIIKVF